MLTKYLALHVFTRYTRCTIPEISGVAGNKIRNGVANTQKGWRGLVFRDNINIIDQYIVNHDFENEILEEINRN